MTFDEFYETAKAIMLGEYDDYLDQIENAVKLRRKDKAPKIWEFKAGDTVRIVHCNPKYLEGALAEVTKVNRTKIVVRLHETASDRFTKFTNITVPTNMVEKV
jgi:transcription antitermination factor NusG